jgi:K+-sensing histidine kinase KdpD
MAAFFHDIHLPTYAAMLLLLLVVLVIARQGSMLVALIGCGVTAMELTLLFLPPIGSIRVAHTSDRLLLALFVLASLVGSLLIRGEKSRRFTSARPSTHSS